jgi:hypothetical protein
MRGRQTHLTTLLHYLPTVLHWPKAAPYGRISFNVIAVGFIFNALPAGMLKDF